MTHGEFQSWLDKMTTHFLEDDFDSFANGIVFPFRMHTAAALLNVPDRDSLREGFESRQRMFHSQGATEMIRTAGHITVLSPDLMRGDYQTEILRNAVRVVPVVNSNMTLHKNGDIWQTSDIRNDMTNTKWPVTIPRTGPMPPSSLISKPGLDAGNPLNGDVK